MKPDPNPDLASQPSRMISLDAFRGLTIAGMILVNNPGDWGHTYAPLKHAEWQGWTPTDLVFPSFMLIVGVAIPLALGKRIKRGDSDGLLARKILIRSCLIFAIGLFLNWFRIDETTYKLPDFFTSMAKLRIPGVLQRIALGYLAGSLIYLFTGVRAQIGLILTLLFGYWALLKLVPIPGIETIDLGDKSKNLASYLDRLILHGHIYKKEYDPEGLLSTLPAIATTLIGVLAGTWLRAVRPPSEKACGIFAGGVVLFALGWSWGAVFPINKALWTSSFVFYCAGLSLQLLGLCMWLIEVMGWKVWAWPFIVFGSNAIAAYVLSSLGVRFLPLIKVAGADGSRINIKEWYLTHALSWADPTFGSLLYALTYVGIWFLFLIILYKLKWFIRV